MAGNANSASSGPPPALVARVNEKKAELEHLKSLRELSAAMAEQMEQLEQKLATLSDGTEGLNRPHSVWSGLAFMLMVFFPKQSRWL
jgi:DASH complex subunit DAD2